VSRAPLVAHVSDLHLGADDPAAVATLAADVAAAAPALTVVTGDCTMRARDGQFRRARALLDRLPAPLLVITGNHDLPLLTPLRLTDPYGRYRRWISADLDPVVRVPGVVAVGLQSTPRWRWKSGGASARQAADVVRVLGAAPAGAVRLLALHHPPFATGAERLVGGRRLLAAVARARVDVVLAGHTHIPDVRVHPLPGGRRIVLVVAGTSASRRTRGTGHSWSAIRVGPEFVIVHERYLGLQGWRTGRTVSVPRSDNPPT
jgi:3',5'-cyclic AMP phosphodiesterase CpdA